MSEFLGHTELQGDVVFNLTFTYMQNKKIPSRKECELMLKLCVMMEFLVLWLRIGTIYEERKNSVDDYDLDYA